METEELRLGPSLNNLRNKEKPSTWKTASNFAPSQSHLTSYTVVTKFALTLKSPKFLTSILPNYRKENIRVVLGDSRHPTTLIPTIDHLLISPYCTANLKGEDYL